MHDQLKSYTDRALRSRKTKSEEEKMIDSNLDY
jgi:hypothetical protein